jgi:hypothetical protein
MDKKKEGCKMNEVEYDQDVEEYLSDEFVDELVDSDELSTQEAWFIHGWKQAFEKGGGNDGIYYV